MPSATDKILITNYRHLTSALQISMSKILLKGSEWFSLEELFVSATNGACCHNWVCSVLQYYKLNKDSLGDTKMGNTKNIRSAEIVEKI